MKLERVLLISHVATRYIVFFNYSYSSTRTMVLDYSYHGTRVLEYSSTVLVLVQFWYWYSSTRVHEYSYHGTIINSTVNTRIMITTCEIKLRSVPISHVRLVTTRAMVVLPRRDAILDRIIDFNCGTLKST